MKKLQTSNTCLQKPPTKTLAVKLAQNGGVKLSGGSLRLEQSFRIPLDTCDYIYTQHCVCVCSDVLITRVFCTAVMSYSYLYYRRL